MLTLALTSVQNWHLLPNDPTLTILCISSLIATVWLAHRRCRPLHHVRGPWLCKISGLVLALADLRYCRNDKILEWHRKYGPVLCIAPNEVSVATLESTRDIYGTAHRWPKSNYFDHFMGYNRRSVFATKPYKEHQAKRRLISAFYQPSTIYKLPHIEQHVQERAQTVLRQIQTNTEVDVYSLTDWYALDIITYLVLGPDCCTRSVETACPERDILARLKQQQFVGSFRIRHPIVYDYISKCCRVLGSRFRHLSADDELAAWCKQRTAKAMKGPSAFDSHSLLRHLLQARESDTAKPPLDRQYIAAEVLDNINAAEATVAVTATYLIWRLTEAPEWQKRIRDELTALLIQSDGFLPFSELDGRVPSLEACLREVYRLHPASSGRAERIVPEGGHVLCGVYLPQGTIVTTSVMALHRDETIFPDPDRFSPGRWLDGDPLTIKKREAHLIPFGHGARICLGKALATLEIKVLIAQIYLRYNTIMGRSMTSVSMRQCSTHDAVPKGLKCVVRFQNIDEKVHNHNGS
ncbi:benzoate 4-monooxygenase cytochrome P450 [Metarhizium acridum CQMa 102]|uniref:Benzoate 4-monooxygenase cytochrome P450 n=2 Tax=Metarhizium acridum TaxID=92637 RepID=E9E6A1_METAQ|nr:benzoate 4-monooxygenase cytochrome P450 [Metarhizium acridum CQMa 102]EFY88505.1 benzoate 4-monooxygenase cytochrome P450 [Metarhizium acridum CQMa 102]